MTRPDGRADNQLLAATASDVEAYAAFYLRHAHGVFAYFMTRLQRPFLC